MATWNDVSVRTVPHGALEPKGHPTHPPTPKCRKSCALRAQVTMSLIGWAWARSNSKKKQWLVVGGHDSDFNSDCKGGPQIRKSLTNHLRIHYISWVVAIYTNPIFSYFNFLDNYLEHALDEFLEIIPGESLANLSWEAFWYVLQKYVCPRKAFTNKSSDVSLQNS